MAVLDIIINTAAHAAARPLLAQKGGTRPGSPPLMTAGDGWDGNVSLRLWFYNAESGAITSTNVRKAGVSLALYAKQSRTEAAPYLFEVAGFSEFQDGEGNYGYEAPVNLNTVELLAAVASGSSADAWVDVVEDGDATTQFQVTIRPQVDSGGALPSPAEPPYPHPSQLATKADLDALRGGVPLTGWANSTAYPFGACTITGGIPTALEFACVTDDFAYAELSLTDFAPDTLDISGTVSAGTVELTDLSLVFLDGAGAEVGTIGALTLGAAFSFASVVVPSGAVKVAVKALGTAATSSLSTGFSALSVTAHANLSELTAEALADILADTGTVAALVTPAQTNAQTIADLVAPAQADASAAGTAKDNAESYEAAAYTAMVNAGNSNKVATDDWRLGLRGGVWTTVNSELVSGGLRPVTPVAGWACLSLNWLSRNHVAQATVQSVTGAAFIADVQFGFYVAITSAGALSMYYNAGAGTVAAGVYMPPAGWQWLHLIWDASARTISFFYDGATAPVATVTIPGTLPCGPLLNVMSGWTASSSAYAALGHVRSASVLNFIPSDAQRLAIMRGEYPHAWLGGAATGSQGSAAWTDSGYTPTGTISTNTGGTLTVSHPGGGANASALKLALLSGPACPSLRIGRIVRARLTAASTTGSVPLSLRDSAGTLLATATTVSTDGAKVVDFTLTAAGNGSLELHIGDTAAHATTITAVSLEVLGAQIIVGPSDWTRTRGVDMSGNCNDLIYGTGVVAIEPATKARVVQATAAGATVSAGAVASVGTLTGATYRDAKALAALRQLDSVSANWRQARPANCAALQAAVTANGTPLVEATAITGNAVVGANAALNLIHHIN